MTTETTTNTVITSEPTPRHVTRRSRRANYIAGAVAIVVAAGVTLAVVNPFASSPTSTSSHATDITTATVTRQMLTEQTQVDATLGYAGSYTVSIPTIAETDAAAGQQVGRTSGSSSSSVGTFTRLPTVGQVVPRGHILYAVNGAPTVLLYGATPAYRTLSTGASGADVRQLNTNLVALGDASRDRLDPRSDYYGAATATAVEKLQHRLGDTETGALTLGQAAFLPSAARVTTVNAVIGGPAQPGATVVQATSTTRDVVAHLDATEQTQVQAGDRVGITLPNNQTIPGRVTSVGTVAAASGSSEASATGSSGSQTPTIDVRIRPVHPNAVGSLDQAPVSVTITTGSVADVLTVPVTALLAQASGGYAVEVVESGGSHRLVPVHLGLFDDADGRVQASGSGLAAGQHVVVPKI